MKLFYSSLKIVIFVKKHEHHSDMISITYESEQSTGSNELLCIKYHIFVNAKYSKGTVNKNNALGFGRSSNFFKSFTYINYHCTSCVEKLG